MGSVSGLGCRRLEDYWASFKKCVGERGGIGGTSSVVCVVLHLVYFELGLCILISYVNFRDVYNLDLNGFILKCLYECMFSRVEDLKFWEKNAIWLSVDFS